MLVRAYFPVGFDGQACSLLHLHGCIRDGQTLSLETSTLEVTSKDKLWEQLLLKKVSTAPYWEKQLASVVVQFVVGF